MNRPPSKPPTRTPLHPLGRLLLQLMFLMVLLLLLMLLLLHGFMEVLLVLLLLSELRAKGDVDFSDRDCIAGNTPREQPLKPIAASVRCAATSKHQQPTLSLWDFSLWSSLLNKP